MTVPSGSVEASTSAGSMVEEQLDGCSAFIMSSTVFLRLIQSEARLMAQIVPQPFHSHVLDHLTKQPIDFFMRDGEVSHSDDNYFMWLDIFSPVVCEVLLKE